MSDDVKQIVLETIYTETAEVRTFFSMIRALEAIGAPFVVRYVPDGKDCRKIELVALA